jgi:hypothetical protein
MQRFDSCRPSQPVRSPPLFAGGPPKANALNNVFPVARQRNVKFVIGSSLNAGFISGSPRYNYGKTSWDIPRQYIEKGERLRAVAAQFGADLRTAALQFSAAPDVAAASRIGWRAASLHGHVPGNLLHPPLVRVNGNAGDLHPSARHQVHPVVPSDHASGRVEPLVLPARSPNLNAYAERWVRSVGGMPVQGDPLWRAFPAASPSEYVEHFHCERNHQGRGNVLLFPRGTNIRRDGPVQCRERLGGLLRYYHQEAG